MAISHCIHSLFEKLGSQITIRSEQDDSQVQVTGIVQNKTGNQQKDSFSFGIQGVDPGRLYLLLSTPEIPFDLDGGARVTQNQKNYQMLAHRYFCEDAHPVYLFALLAEEVPENELL